MKKYLIFAWLLSLILVMTACGGDQAVVSEGAAPETASSETASSVEASVESAAEEPAAESYTVDMLYYLQLGDGTIMAACYTEEGVETMGSDYYVIHVSDAEIFNAAGETITLDALTRGCPIRIEWPGMVMESYPAQITAVKITALSDEADASVPSEEELMTPGEGKWWVPELQTEIPGLTMEYSTPDFNTAVFLTAEGTGAWEYTEDGQIWTSMNIDGEHPLDWSYDDNNTCKRVGYDTVTFVCGTPWSEITVEAYVNGSREPQEISVAGDGSISLLDEEEVIYVIRCKWEAENYNGSGEYAVKIIVPAES